jgi:circadian clock protein KaiC
MSAKDFQTMADDDRVRIPLLQTGVPNLDAILGGGLPELSLSLIAGPPGAGKTTLAQQMLFHAATAARPAIYFSVFGEPAVKLLRYQQQFTFFDPGRVGREVFYVDLADAMRDGGVRAMLKAITSEVERRNPGLIALDSFRSIQDLAQINDASLRTFTHDLALLLASWNTTSLLIGEYRIQDIETNPEFTIADGIIWLSQETHQNAVSRKLQVIKLRGMSSLPGRHAFRITSGGLQAFPRLAPIPKMTSPVTATRASFGVAGLDEMLRGGIPTGQVCLVAGSSGTGKTLLALHFMVAGAQQGQPGVLVTFEERPQEHIRKARSFGWDLEALEAQGLLRMIYLRPMDLSVDEVLTEITRTVTDIGATRVVINSISGFELAITPSEHDDFREALYRLVNVLTGSGATVLVTTEVSDLFGDVRISTHGVSFIADNIILLRYAEIESALRKVMMVIKMRTSDHEKELRQYRITDNGIAVEAPFTQYSGVLSGIPTLRALGGPLQTYAPALTPEEETLIYVLMSLNEASADQLADGLNLSESQVQATLNRLLDTSYVVRTSREGRTLYRVSMAMPGAIPRRFGQRKQQSER